MKEFKFSEIQANAILAMQLRRLTGLQRKEIEDQLAELIKLIGKLEKILADEKDVGVSIMLLDEKMDHGKIISNFQFPISKLENEWPPRAYELEETLAREGGKLLAEVLPKWTSGSIETRDQDHPKATFTKKISKEDGLIDEGDIVGKPYETFLKIRAYDPWPGVFFFAERGGKRIRIKIKDAVYENGVLKISRVIPENGHEMSYSDFLLNIKN